MMSRGSSVRIVLQQMEDGVAQHLDLAAPAVARMHADAVVVGGEQRPPVDVATGAPGRRAVGPDVVLHLLQQRRRLRSGCLGARLRRAGRPSRAPAASRGRRAPTTAAEDASPRPRWGPRTGGGGATSGRRQAPAVPQRRRRMQEEEVDLASRAHRLEHVEVARRKPGQPEQGQAGRMRQQLGLVTQPLAGVDQALRRARLPDPGPQPAPQLHLPDGLASSSGPSAQRRTISGRCTA